MKRRSFLQTSLATAASLYGHAAPARRGESIGLSNSWLEWNLDLGPAGVGVTGFQNKLSGRYVSFSHSQEISLTFSASRQRLEIPWWKWTLGHETAADPGTPDPDGLHRGYHLRIFPEETKWGGADNLYLHDVRGLGKPPGFIYRGYAWFRQHFTLPEEARNEEVVLGLGGYDQEDWNRYWVYVNGVAVGTRSSSGRWRDPGLFTLRPGSEAHQALSFGESAGNTLAICVRDYDKTFGGHPRNVMARALFTSNLVDQFVSVGHPYRTVSDFEVKTVRKSGAGESPGVIISLSNAKDQTEVETHYELNGFTRRKWLEVKNVGQDERLLLDVQMDDVGLEEPVGEGGYGFPVFIGGDAFCGIEYPTGLNQGLPGRVRLRHFAGKTLKPGAVLQTKVSCFGVAKSGEAPHQFVDYIRNASPRPQKMLSMYGPFGINSYAASTLEEQDVSEATVLDALRDVRLWKEMGIAFDHFWTDSGWFADLESTRLDYREDIWPAGPMKAVEEAEALGMRYGTWFDATFPDWGMGNSANLEASRRPNPEGYWPPLLYRNGVLQLDFQRCMCVSAEPYAHLLKDAILHHVKDFRVRGVKLDNGRYYCNSSQHGHLPGKYSTEANYESVINIIKAIKKEAPGALFMGYWGIGSPYFCLFGDTLFESGMAGEGTGLADYPTVVHRDSSTHLVDQGSHLARLIPPSNRDSLGVWITNTSWGSFVKAERWLEALVMDLGRGNLIFPQCWGDLTLIPEDEVTVLSRLVRLARAQDRILLQRRHLLGDPWENTVYGYSYFEGDHGFVFLNNVHFQSRPFNLVLDSSLGFVGAGPVSLCRHFPETRLLVGQGKKSFAAGQTLSLWLRPFEVAMFEIGPDSKLSGKENFPIEELPEQPVVLGQKLGIVPMDLRPDSDIDFSEAERLTQRGFVKRRVAFRTHLPEFSQPRPLLAIVARHMVGGEPFRQNGIAELSQIHARIGEKRVYFYTTPGVRQTVNVWNHWVVFHTVLNQGMQDKELQCAVTSYLPPDAYCELEAWQLPAWWGGGTQAQPRPCKGMP